MPMAGMIGSDLMRQFRTVRDPYTRDDFVAIPAIAPDVTIMHVHEADEQGNLRIHGAKYDDLLMAKAAKRVIVTCERLISASQTTERPDLTDLPGFLVDAVVVVPGGAWPHGCDGEYDYDEAFFRAYLDATASDQAYAAFLVDSGVIQ